MVVSDISYFVVKDPLVELYPVAAPMDCKKVINFVFLSLAIATPIISINLEQTNNTVTIQSENLRYKRNAQIQRSGGIGQPLTDQFYVKVAIFADASMSEHYGDKLHRHLNVVMKKVARLFRHPTIGNVSFHFARPEIIELSKLPKGEQFSPQSPDLFIEFRAWRIDKIDHLWPSIMNNHASMLITRKNLLSDVQIGGLALLGGITELSSSYFTVTDVGHRSAGVIAHEFGHLLGVDHDSNKPDIHSIMSHTVSYSLSPTWSEESRDNFTILLRSGRFNLFLMKNDEEHPRLIPTDGPEYWVTDSYTRAEQCEVQYGPDNKYQPTVPEELETCEFLHCGHFESDSFVQAPNWVSYNPIEDGTFCLTKTSRGGICVDNYCVESKCQMKI